MISFITFFAIGCFFLGMAAIINMAAQFLEEVSHSVGDTDSCKTVESLKEGRQRILWLYFWVSLPLLYHVATQTVQWGPQ